MTKKTITESGWVRRPVEELHLAACIGQLAPLQKTVLELAYVEGHEQKETATALGMQPSCVRVTLFRTKRKLAGMLRGM